MAPPATLTTKLKVQLKMAIQRLRMLQQKSSAIAKQQRRHMAELLSESKLESARIRVENIIRSDITTELHEILELYCELLLARIQLLDQIPSPGKDKTGDEVELDGGLDEAVRAVVFAAPKTEIKELILARALLVEKFGKEFAVECAAGTKVPERVLKRLRVETPKAELVDAYLREIGRTYGVRFPGDVDDDLGQEEGEGVGANVDGDDDDDDDDDGVGGGSKNAPIAVEELAAAPHDAIGKPSVLRIAPPSPTVDNISPTVRLPGGDAKGVRPPTGARKASLGTAKVKKDDGAAKKGGPGGDIPDVNELAKRFAALKRT